MEIMPQVFVFEKKLYKAETNGSKMIKVGAKCLKMVAMRRSRCDQGIRKRRKCFDLIFDLPQVFVFEKKLYTAETNGPKMIKFGAKCL